MMLFLAAVTASFGSAEELGFGADAEVPGVLPSTTDFCASLVQAAKPAMSIKAINGTTTFLFFISNFLSLKNFLHL
jgi:hypothetical protein